MAKAHCVAAVVAVWGIGAGPVGAESPASQAVPDVPLRRPIVFSYNAPWGSDKNPNSGYTDPDFMNFRKVRLTTANLVDHVNVPRFLAQWKTPHNRILARTGLGKKEWTSGQIVEAWDQALKAPGIDGMGMDEFIGRDATPKSMAIWIEAVREIRRRHPAKVLAYWTDSGLGMVSKFGNAHAPLLLALRDAADYVMPEIYYRESSAPDFKTKQDPFPAFRKKVEEWEAAAPGITAKVLMGLGTVQNAEWRYDDRDDIDYEDFLVRQVEVCATDPILKKTAGLALYAPGYLKPEILTRVDNAIIRFYGLDPARREP
jgi:hypothetical protein